MGLKVFEQKNGFGHLLTRVCFQAIIDVVKGYTLSPQGH